MSAEQILWITVAGHSAAHQMASVARAWLSTNPTHEMTFLAYEDQRSIVTSKHESIVFESFGQGPIEPKDRAETARRLEADNVDGMAFLLEKFADPYDDEVQTLDKVFKSSKPDLVVVDMLATAALDYLAFHNVPYVVFYHCIALGVMGIEDSFALPEFMYGETLADRTFWNRLKQVFGFARIVAKTAGTTEKLNQARRRNGFPTYNAPDTNIQGHPIIVPSSFGFDYARRISPLVHLVGFIIDDKSIEAVTDEDKALIEWINAPSARPVVYASFGTEMTLSEQFLTNLIEGVNASNNRLLLAARPAALTAGDVNLPMLLEKLDSKSLNMVKHVEWVNQPMVLAQPPVKVFVTHGGASSIAEAVHAHVPMILVPSGGDRQANAARLVDQAYCKSLNLLSFTADDMTVAVEQLLGNETVVERLKWLERVNEHAGGGCPGAARQLQYILEDGYQHLVPVDSELGALAASGSLDLVLVGVILFQVLVYVIYIVIWKCFGSRDGSAPWKTKIE